MYSFPSNAAMSPRPFGIVDICSFLLIVLPLYPNMVEEHIYSVNLLAYTQNNSVVRMMLWVVILASIICGVVKCLLVQCKMEKGRKLTIFISIGISIFAVLFLAVAREGYAIIVTFILLVIKGILLLRYRDLL